MKPGSTKRSLQVALGLSLFSLLVCAGIALYSVTAAYPKGSPIFALFPTALSIFPVVGLVAAVVFTQVLKRRRSLQLKAIDVDRG